MNGVSWGVWGEEGGGGVFELCRWFLEPISGFIKIINKKPRFSWVCWLHCQNNKTHRAGLTGFINK